MEFVGRRSELAELAEWWHEKGPRPALVWGRRRSGKSALLAHFATTRADCPVVFHTGAAR